jgi:RHS repeat-associated protein
MTETIAYPGQSNRTHNLDYAYDMRSQLTDASISNINGYPWVYNYRYRLDGNIERKTVNSTDTDYEYDTTPGGSIFDSDLMTKAGEDSLTCDLNNGWLTNKTAISFVYNWEGKLRSSDDSGSNSISIKYDPMGNRVVKNSSVNGNRKYIVEISGELPTILLELDPNDDMEIKKTYIYANSQILAQHDGDSSDPRYFYLHDRLGSVRLLINTSGITQNSYMYNPFGELFTTECAENINNPFKFTGQWYDSEISQYYLRARQNDPALMRFTSRDPFRGSFRKPLTLHRYLYCQNDPINNIDPTGEYEGIGGLLLANAFRGALMGALSGGLYNGLITQSWKGFAEGAIFGGIGGAVSGLASVSAAGYIFAVIENSPAMQGAIAGATSGLAKGLYKKDDLEKLFIRASVNAIGGMLGGWMGEIQPPCSGIPGGIAGGGMAVNFYNFFFSLFGGWPYID